MTKTQRRQNISPLWGPQAEPRTAPNRRVSGLGTTLRSGGDIMSAPRSVLFLDGDLCACDAQAGSPYWAKGSRQPNTESHI